MKTYQEYHAEVIRVKQRYLEDKYKHNWTYTFEETKENNYYVFTISNLFLTTIVKFDEEFGYLNTCNLSTSQLETCLKQRKELEGLS